MRPAAFAAKEVTLQPWSPRKLALYFWLTYRYTTISAPVVIPWELLKEQFGFGYARPALPRRLH
jgi:hypothetical protein